MERKLSRKRLRPWLEMHANANTFRGLKWLDKEKKIFLIYWKHQSNRSWDVSDAELFKAWALYTGKYKEGDPETPPEWKTRLRTALTKLPDIEEMKELHNLTDQDNPYKAYRFLDEAAVNKSKCEMQPSPFSESGYSDSSSSSFQASPISQINFLEVSDDEMDPHDGMNDMNNIPTVVFDNVKHHTMDHMNIVEIKPSNLRASDICRPPMDPEPDVFRSPSNVPFEARHHQSIQDNDLVSQPQQQQQQIDLPQDLMSIDSGGLVPLNPHIVPNNLSLDLSMSGLEYDPPSVSSLSHQSPHVLEMQVYILGKCVFQDYIDTEARLFSGDSPWPLETMPHLDIEKTFGSMNLKQIRIPEIDQISDLPVINAKQRKLVRDIQDNMLRGLLIGGNTNNIYTQRLCKARVSTWTQMRTVEKLNRDNGVTCVFDMELFKQQLREFCETNVSQPSPYVTFIFGQQYKGDWLDMSHVLFCVKITHLEADKLLKQAVDSASTATEDFASKSNPEDFVAEIVVNMTQKLNIRK